MRAVIAVALALTLAMGGVAALLARTRSGRGEAAEVAEDSVDLRARIARALAPYATAVERTDRLPGPVAGSQGQYVARLKGDGREVGLFVMAYAWPEVEAPFFWINLHGDPPGQVVLVPEGDRLVEDSIPPDWIMSDYLRARRPTRSPSFIALNPRRVLRRAGGSGERYVADSGFVPEHPVTRHLLARTHWWIERETGRVRALSLMVHRTVDEAEANTLMQALESSLLASMPRS